MLTIKEYREILNDQTSSEEQITKRLQYLDAFCRNVIRLELKNVCQKKQIKQSKKEKGVVA